MNKTFNQASIDIILPNYNSADYISETIDSIINQTLKKWNLINIKEALNTTYDLEIIMKKNSDIDKKSMVKKLIVDLCNLANAS